MRRILVATVIALALASVGCVRARHGLVDVPDVCKYLPDWWPGCGGGDTAGGGGSGAS